ncbi:MAG: UDP-glucose 6-dehydrogenase [Gemmataceae bacterium]|nr:UDP-glucose 6-dehydrogenase [Gemmataceae bacterium]
MTDLPTLSVVGLGKLGQCFAAVFAAKGFTVVGVDRDDRAVASLRRGVASVHEPGLQALIDTAAGRLSATHDVAAAVEGSDTTFIIVPTPSNADGTFSNTYVEAVLTALAGRLRASAKPYHLFVLNSTVMPGSAEGVFIPLLERVSGRRVNEGFGFCYAPAFIALGDVVKGLTRPDVVVIGQSDERAGALAESVYRRMCANEPPVVRTSPVNIEIMKLSLNCYVTLKISFANTLAHLCERTPGADVDVITRALGADRRIGSHYLRAGLSFGGPCFPRDGKAIVAYGRALGVGVDLFEALDVVNSYQHRHLEDVVVAHLPPGGPARVAVLGLAYKPNTPVIDESPGVDLVRRLLARGIAVVAYDPLALDTTRAVFGDRIEYAASAKECVSRAPVCVVATTEDEFKEVGAGDFAGPAVVIDCWRMLAGSRLGPRVEHVLLGNGPTRPA